MMKRQGNQLIENVDGSLELGIPGESEMLLKYAM
jgi:hypothetical protein